jgi:hypothetical protein
VVERDAIAIRASALADYADVSVFVPEQGDDGAVVPPSWFGLNPSDGEDSAEEIASSDEGDEGDEDEEGGRVSPDGGATSRTRFSPAPTSDQPETTSAAADRQAETPQPAAPPARATPTADQSVQLEGPSA